MRSPEAGTRNAVVYAIPGRVSSALSCAGVDGARNTDRSATVAELDEVGGPAHRDTTFRQRRWHSDIDGKGSRRSVRLNH
jgi:hypothetical protein